MAVRFQRFVFVGGRSVVLTETTQPVLVSRLCFCTASISVTIAMLGIIVVLVIIL